MLTIIIPTYNRSDILIKTVRRLQARKVRVPVIVADGSDGSHAARNAECVGLGDNISYFHLVPKPGEDPWQNYALRLKGSLERATTPFCVFSAEDDILITENAIEAAKFLEVNRDYAGCHGHYLQYQSSGTHIEVAGIAYSGRSIDGATFPSRLMQMFSNYESPFYAVFSRETQQQLCARYMEAERPLWPELNHTTAAIVAGKIHRQDTIYSLRYVDIAPHFQPIEDLTKWVARDARDFLNRYDLYCQHVSQWLSAAGDRNLDAHTLRRALDMSLAVYLGRMFSMPDWINDYASLVSLNDADRAALIQRVRQNMSGTVILPLKVSLRHVVKSLLGAKWISAAQNARAYGLRYALDRLPSFDAGRLKARLTGAESSVRVRKDLMHRFSRREWEKLRR